MWSCLFRGEFRQCWGLPGRTFGEQQYPDFFPTSSADRHISRREVEDLDTSVLSSPRGSPRGENLAIRVSSCVLLRGASSQTNYQRRYRETHCFCAIAKLWTWLHWDKLHQPPSRDWPQLLRLAASNLSLLVGQLVTCGFCAPPSPFCFGKPLKALGVIAGAFLPLLRPLKCSSASNLSLLVGQPVIWLLFMRQSIAPFHSNKHHTV
mmetsp:Transcript_39797/g.93118  ORF Transcript_39797/g.93118 Transcript_39797/m.93118 type:complete len:207 (-) Transcript_39797:112-732(-)